MGKDKNKDNGETATSETNSPLDTHQDTQDLSQDRKAWDAALAQTIAEAVTREMAKAHAHYQAILNERGTATLQTNLKVSSGAKGFKVMDPSIGQRTNLSTRDGNCGQKRLDSPLMPWREFQRKLKISYFYHWINGERMGHIESWKSNKTLISQSAYDALENTEASTLQNV